MPRHCIAPDPQHPGESLVTMRHMMTGEPVTVQIPASTEAIRSWRDGDTPVQFALPQLDANAREFLVSGLPPGAFEELFGEEDDLEEAAL